MKEKTNNPRSKQDEVFKKVLSYPEIAQDFFDMHLPSSVKSLVDLKTLKLEKESFIREDLSRQYSDILFSVDIDNGAETSIVVDPFKLKVKPTAASSTRKKSKPGNKGYIYILLEHQSSVDQLMAFRLFNVVHL